MAMIKAKLLGGAVWQACPLTEVSEFEVASSDGLIPLIADELSHLPREQALAVAQRLLAGEGPVLAGYAGTRAGLVAEPPAAVEIIDRSRYGDPVYLLEGDSPDWVYEEYQGEVYEPYYVDLFIIEEGGQ